MHKLYDWPRAFRALRVLLADPDDTQQVFVIIDALAGRAPRRNLRRLSRDPAGAKLLAEKPNILELLQDRAYLAALPAGSLGRAYLEFIDAEGITPQGLVEASRVPSAHEDIDADLEYLRGRLRDTHDLWHAVTGYKGDLVGEGALLAFSFAQTRHLGVGLIILAAFLRGAEIGLRREVLLGIARGVRARSLIGFDWEQQLSRPLEEVRKALRIGAPPRYRAVRTSDFATEAA